MLLDNPEFRKNFRLEVNLTRVVSCFALILFILFALYNSNSANDAGEFFGVFCGIGYFLVIIWGTYLSAASISEEVRQKTWDFVRMSSLSPGKILTGKLFGSTSLIWIVGLIGIFPVVIGAAAFMMPEANLRGHGITLLVLSLCLLCWSIFSHAAGMVLSLYGLLVTQTKEKMNTIGATLMIAFGGIFTGAFILNAFEAFHKTYRMEQAYKRAESWYGIQMLDLDMALLCLAFATFWLVVGAYRMLRQTLLFHDMPWAWIAFLVIASVFLNGFTPDQDFAKLLIWPILLCSVTTALMAISESRNIISYKTLAARFSSRQYGEAFRFIPLWMLSFAGLVLALVISLIVIDHQFWTIMSVASVLTFAVRDLLVLHWISWKPNIRRPLMGFVIYGTIVYFLLPIILGSNRGFLMPLAPQGDLAHFITGQRGDGWLFFYWAFQLACVAGAAWLFSRRWSSALARVTPPEPQVPPQTAA